MLKHWLWAGVQVLKHWLRAGVQVLKHWLWAGVQVLKHWLWAGVADLPHTGGVEIQPTFWQRRCWRPEDQQRRRERGRGLQREQLNGEQLLIEDGDVDLEEDELEFGNEEEELVDAGRERAAAGSPSRCQ